MQHQKKWTSQSPYKNLLLLPPYFFLFFSKTTPHVYFLPKPSNPFFSDLLTEKSNQPFMTNYGTIPTSSSATPIANMEYLSRAKDRIKSGLGTRRPWKLMFDYRSVSLPRGISDALIRIKTNAVYFRMNYAITALFVLFLSLLWHPVSLIVFVVMMAAWLFLYFLRDEPLAVFGKTIDDRAVLIVLGVVTIVLLLLTHATLNILVSVAIGLVIVTVHAALRKTDDLFVDEEAARGLMTGVVAASSSSSS